MFPRWRSPESELPDQGTKQPTFSHLLNRARSGESEAISTLYRQFLPGMFGYIATRVPDRSIAEDLTSELFLKMIEGLHRVRTSDEAGFAAWLLQIARATVAGYYRKRENQPLLVTLDPINGEGDEVLASQIDTDPVLLAEVRAEWGVVVQAINTLTEEQRQVLVARLIMGYDVATVARMIGKNANAVKALQFRALQSLRRLLDKGDLHLDVPSTYSAPIPVSTQEHGTNVSRKIPFHHPQHHTHLRRKYDETTS